MWPRYMAYDVGMEKPADIFVLKPATPFQIGDYVQIDGCKDLRGVVTAVTWRAPEIINYEVSWVTNGDAKSSVIEGWRLGYWGTK